MSKITIHGKSIADKIQEEDAYGQVGVLTLADIWLIIDSIHTHFMYTERDTKFLSKWLRELGRMDSDLPAI